MDMMPLKPERKAELEAYAQRHGNSPADALDDVQAAQLEWEREDMKEAVKGMGRGYEYMKAGRVLEADEFLEALRLEHGFPRCPDRERKTRRARFWRGCENGKLAKQARAGFEDCREL